MERLVIKCENLISEDRCPTQDPEMLCTFKTTNGYCGYRDEFVKPGTISQIIDKLGQLEDEAEQRERGCGECIRKSCDICTSKIYNYVCDECDDYSNYEPMNYCPTCGRKLVK